MYAHTSIFVESSGAVWKSRWPSRAPIPNKPSVSVDVKQRSTYLHNPFPLLKACNLLLLSVNTHPHKKMLFALFFGIFYHPFNTGIETGTWPGLNVLYGSLKIQYGYTQRYAGVHPPVHPHRYRYISYASMVQGLVVCMHMMHIYM